MSPVFIVILLAIVGVMGDFFMKLAGSGPTFMHVKWFVVAALLYMSTTVGWFYVMKHIKLSSLGVVYSLTTVLLLVVVGTFYFHEKLNGYEIAGIVTAVTSIVLLSRFA